MRTQKMLMCALACTCTLVATNERLSATMAASQKFEIPESPGFLLLRQNIAGSVDRGNQLMREGDYKEAIKAFQNAIKLDKTSAGAWAGQL